MALLMYMQHFESLEAVLNYYNEKRFSKVTYAVDQPCQIRYLQFFKDVLEKPHQFVQLRAYRLSYLLQTGLTENHYVRISSVRDNRERYSALKFEKMEEDGLYLMGDVFIEIMERGTLQDSRVARINYNLEFMGKEGDLYRAEL